MPTAEIYLPEDVYERLRDAAKALRLPQKAFMRAILIAAVTELERTEGRILPGDQPAPSERPRQPAREGGTS
ncbi:MAG: hypothetical protein M5U29_04265 [Anaerolineae bacterium]|nr:hypothetical protein [Anaerolineae bacterium]